VLGAPPTWSFPCGGRYFDQRGWVFNPQVITVRSNLGGSATATVTS